MSHKKDARCKWVNVMWLFLTVPWFGLHYVIVVFPDHTHFFYSLRYLSTLYSHPDWPEKSPSQLHQELRDSIKSTPLWLLNPASIYRYLSRIIAKRSQGQPVSFTDFFGHLVGETLLQGVSTSSFSPLKSQSHLQQTTNILISY